MSLWVQHGFGKGDKIARLAAEGAIEGIVLSPADEDLDGLREIAAMAQSKEISCWLDPQTYVYSISSGVGRLHTKHSLKFPDLDWSADPDSISAITKAVIRANRKIGLGVFVSPAPLQRTLDDRWAPLGLQFARSLAKQVGDDVTVASLVIHESALDHWSDVEDWLNSVTRLSIHGFYIIVNRSAGSDYPAAWHSDRLASLYRTIYRLRVLNEYEVVLGYTDVDGLAAAAMGAGMASGWFHSLRRFVEAKWRPHAGGAPTTPRFLSTRLMVPLRVDEARDLIQGDEGRLVAPTSAERAPLQGLYTIADARLQHLRALAKLAGEFRGDDPARQLQALQRRLTAARVELLRLGQTKLSRGINYANQVGAISEAIAEFRKAEGLGEVP